MEESLDGARQDRPAQAPVMEVPQEGQPYQPGQEQYWSPPPQPPVKGSSKTMTILIIIIMILAPLSIIYVFNEASKRPAPEIGVSIYDVSEIRGLEVLEEVPYKFMTDKELEVAIEEMLDEEGLNETGRILYSLFLMDSVEEQGEVYGDVLADQVMGYYDTETKEMVIVETGFSATFDAITLSHEFTHALQDQHFNLSSIMNGTWDEATAIEALIEGDAVKVMAEYTMSLSLSEQMGLISDFEGMDEADTPDMPYAIEQILMFPYMRGMTFVQLLYETGGWDAVDRAYERLPASSEHILHFDKYASREAPLDVYPDISYQGMERTINETLGEFMVSTMLGRYIPTEDAEEGAAGWGGDNYQYWENEDDFVSVWTIEWDDQAECDEFYDTYLEWIDDPDNPYSGDFDDGFASIIKDGGVTTLYRASSSTLVP